MVPSHASHDRRDNSSPRRWSLRALFALTTLAAVYFAIARWIPEALFHFTAILATTTALMLGRGRRWHPLLSALAGMAAGIGVGAASYGWLVSDTAQVFYRWQLEPVAMGAVLGAVYGMCCSGVFLASAGVRFAMRRDIGKRSSNAPD